MNAPAARRRGGLVLVTVLAVLAFAVLVGLGTWQVQRLAWKEALIATVETRLAAAPVEPPPPSWTGLDLADVDYLRVELSGRFLPGEALVYTVLSDARGPLRGPGYWVVSPFETDAGWIVLVNRGFVPVEGRGAAPHPAAPEGAVTLQGILRGADPPGLFTPSPDLERKVWFVRDAAVLAPAFDLPPDRPLAPYTIDAAATLTPPGGLPQAGETRSLFPNSHLQYAVTWFGLALALVAVYGLFVIQHLRGGGHFGRHR